MLNFAATNAMNRAFGLLRHNVHMINAELSISLTGITTLVAALCLSAPSQAEQKTDPMPIAAVAVEAMESSFSKTPGVLQVKAEADGLFYIEGQADGHKIRMLVDTGASHTVLTARDAAKLKIQYSQHGASTLITAGGRTRVRSGNLAELTVGNQRLTDLPVSVVDSALPVSLLGRNALTKMGDITISGDNLEFSGA